MSSAVLIRDENSIRGSKILLRNLLLNLNYLNAILRIIVDLSLVVFKCTRISILVAFNACNNVGRIVTRW